VAPQLAEQFSVTVPDLRGYGKSGKPQHGKRHENYSFRALAHDQVDVMRHYGHERLLLIQPFPPPEHMIGRDAEFYLREVFGGLNKTPGAIVPDVVNECVREFANPDSIHSTCEDFRAAADIDLEMDNCGHFLQEERPQDLLAELRDFF
jgi:haloacetate dehalogenase